MTTTARHVVTGLGWPALAGPQETAPIGWQGTDAQTARVTSIGDQGPETNDNPDAHYTGSTSAAGAPADERVTAQTESAVETPAPSEEPAESSKGEPGTSSTSESEVESPLPRPTTTRVLTVSNQKGGVGKTTTAVNIAAALAEGGLRVLLIDTDPQGNASTALNVDHRAEVPSIYDVLIGGAGVADVVQASPDVDNLWCIPATIDLAGAEIELVSLVARESRLSRALEAWRRTREESGEDRIDYVIIDCPPSLGLLTVNAFVAAEEVLIPIQCEYYALEGLSQLISNIDLIRTHLNPTLHVSTILLTMYDARTRLSAQVADEVRAHFPDEVLESTVPRSVRVSEAPSYGQTVITYDPQSTGARCYQSAAGEIAHRGAKPKDNS